MSDGRVSEGRRVLRNVASIGAFAISPVQMFLLVRALGPNGYGRWWWTFVLLEAATILGLLGAELYVRREVPSIDRDGGGEEEALAVVGSSLAVVTVAGIVLGVLLLAIAGPVAAAQDDPDLAIFLAVLGFQPLLWNFAVVLIAALQSRHILTSVAVLRGIVLPVLQSIALVVAWRARLDTRTTLLLVLAATVLGVSLLVTLYARHFSLARTLRHALRPRRARDALSYGTRLFVPVVLLTISGRLDLYALGSDAGATAVGVYAGCLQLALGIVFVRMLFDPIIQTQIATLYATDRAELAASLRRLARLSTFAMAPVVVVIVAVGEPLLAFLLGRPVPEAVVPLVILASGQLLVGVAVASWLVPMMLPGRALVLLAGLALTVKVALLLLLVHAYGASGAAVATIAANFIAIFGQVWFGGRDLGHRPYSLDVVPMLVVTGVIAAAGRWLYLEVAEHHGVVVAIGLAGGAALTVLVVVQWWLLTPHERISLYEQLGLCRR